MTGPKIRPKWEHWEDLPGWLQGATWWAYWCGGPLDERDVERLESGIRNGVSLHGLFEREEPRWMVKALLLLREHSRIEPMRASDAWQAVALWHGKSLSAETIRRRCVGDPSLDRKSGWVSVLEGIDKWCRDNPDRLPSGVAHRYHEVVLGRFPFGKGHPQEALEGAVIRIPYTTLAVVKGIARQRNGKSAPVYYLKDASTVAGTEIQSLSLDRTYLKGQLGFWLSAKVTLPALSEKALGWFRSLDPNRPFFDRDVVIQAIGEAHRHPIRLETGLQ